MYVQERFGNCEGKLRLVHIKSANSRRSCSHKLVVIADCRRQSVLIGKVEPSSTSWIRRRSSATVCDFLTILCELAFITRSSGLKIGRDLFGGRVVWCLSERNWSPLEPWHSLSLQDVCFYYITLDVIVHEDINRLLISSLRPSSNVELFMRWTYANDQNPLHVRAHLL